MNRLVNMQSAGVRSHSQQSESGNASGPSAQYARAIANEHTKANVTREFKNTGDNKNGKHVFIYK